MRKSTVDWPVVLKDYQESGLSQKRFCEQSGVSLSSLSYWLKKARGPAVDETDGVASTFVELGARVVEPAPVSVGRRGDNRGDLVVELPFGVVLRFRGVTR